MTKHDLFEKLYKPELNERSNILLLTHTDADGEVPALILKLLFDNVVVKHCSNGSMDRDILHSVIDESEGAYDFIFVTDISCKSETAERIDVSKNASKVILLDHHGNSLYLNQYKWACVMPDVIDDSVMMHVNSDTKPVHSSAASLVYDYFDYIDAISNSWTSYQDKLIRDLVINTTLYDTWDWSDVYGRKFQNPYYINVLHDTYGDDVFEDRYMNRFKDNRPNLFDNTDNMMIRVHETKLVAHLDSVKRYIRTGNWLIEDRHYSVVYLNTDRFLNETSDYLRNQYPDAELVIINYGTGLSIRTTDSDINVGEICAKLGGGGHPGAGGIRIKFDSIIDCINASTETTLYIDK